MRLNTISENTENVILDIFGLPVALLRPLVMATFRPVRLSSLVLFTDRWKLRFAAPATYLFASLLPLSLIALVDQHIVTSPANTHGLLLLQSVALSEGSSFSLWDRLPTTALPLVIVLITSHALSWLVTRNTARRERIRATTLYAFGTQAFLMGANLLIVQWIMELARTSVDAKRFIDAWAQWVASAAVVSWWLAVWSPFMVMSASIVAAERWRLRIRRTGTPPAFVTALKLVPALALYTVCSAAYMASIPAGHRILHRVLAGGPPCLTATIESAKYVRDKKNQDEIVVDVDVWNGARDTFTLDRSAFTVLVSGSEECPVRGPADIADVGWSAAGAPTIALAPQNHEMVRLRAHAYKQFCYLKSPHAKCGPYNVRVTILGRGRVTRERLARGCSSPEVYLCNADAEAWEPSEEQFAYDD